MIAVPPPSFLSDSIVRARSGASLPTASVILRGLATLVSEPEAGCAVACHLFVIRSSLLSILRKLPYILLPSCLSTSTITSIDISSSLKLPYDLE